MTERSLRDILALDEREKLIGLAQTGPGKLAIFLVAWAAVATYFEWWMAALLVGAAMASAYLPKHRNAIIFVTTWTVIFLKLVRDKSFIPDSIQEVMLQEHIDNLSPLGLACAALLLFAVCAWFALRVARRHKTLFFARRPVISLLVVGVLLCALTTVTHGLYRVLPWSLLLIYSQYIWFLAYALVDQRARDCSPPLFQLGVFHPFWSTSSITYGKGAAFLRKTLFKTPAELAVTQIKGLKLLIWSNLLYGISNVLTWLAEEQLHIPSIELALDAFLLQQPYAVWLGWASLTLSTVEFCFLIAYGSHLFIGIARLAGFRLPRGVWRPLESRTLMDYFNRSHYYFKELLVDFFFMPTFFVLFKKHPRLRMFFATFMAAGVGNAVWHFIRDIDVVATMGLWHSFETYTSYIFYTVVLATGLGLSQVRLGMGIKPSATLVGRVYSFALVWSFVVCLRVFSDESRKHSLNERFSFLLSLFGVS